jgi:hydrogenase maturation protease
MTIELPLPAKSLVIGIGNAYRSDDALGLIAARRLKGRLPTGSVLEHDGEGSSMMKLWTGADRVIVIDAMCSAAVPGTIRRFDVTHCPLPVPTFGKSTHAFGLAEAVELSRALHQLPHELIIYGVEGQDLGPGTTLSVAMEPAINNVVERVLQEV